MKFYCGDVVHSIYTMFLWVCRDVLWCFFIGCGKPSPSLYNCNAKCLYSIVSNRKLTGRKPSLQEIMAEWGFFIQPSKKLPPPLASSITNWLMLSQALSHKPSGFCPSQEIKTCPSLISQLCSMGFSYFADKS